MASEHSQACLHAVVAKAGPYEGKGRWTEIDGKKTYVTGPSTAENGILYIYDVFSFKPQSIQGADILARSASKSTLVVMVDWFDGGAVQDEWMASADGRKLMHQFVENTSAPSKVLPSVVDVLSKLKDTYPGIKKWGGVGFCWGGKLVSLLAAKGDASPLAVAAQSSPARLDPEEAKTVTVPMAVLASSKEAGDALDRYGQNLKGVKHVEVFDSQVHGWMSARGKIEKPDVRSEYERGYKILVDFFGKYL